VRRTGAPGKIEGNIAVGRCEKRSAAAMLLGMLGVTVLGLIFMPVFYIVRRWISGKIKH
jgi:multidrug efflux pump subunit AcrB